jgi:hypothetical protein
VTPRPIYDLFYKVDTDGPDLLFMGPTKECVCGSTMFHAIVWFDTDSDEREIAGRFTEMACVSCGALVHGVTEDPTEKP